MNEFSQSYFIRLYSTLSLLLTLKFDHLICAPYLAFDCRAENN
jgi:hypothetical protein